MDYSQVKIKNIIAIYLANKIHYDVTKDRLGACGINLLIYAHTLRHWIELNGIDPKDHEDEIEIVVSSLDIAPLSDGGPKWMDVFETLKSISTVCTRRLPKACLIDALENIALEDEIRSEKDGNLHSVLGLIGKYEADSDDYIKEYAKKARLNLEAQP